MEIQLSGLGGQGVLAAGMIIAQTAAEQGLEVLWMPSFEGSVRGGMSSCVVKYGTEPIVDPIAHTPDIIAVLAAPPADFDRALKSHGMLILNSSMVGDDAEGNTEAQVLRIPMTDIAVKEGNESCTGMVLLGAIVTVTKDFEKDLVRNAMCRFFENKGKGRFNEANCRAFDAGCRSAAEKCLRESSTDGIISNQ